jgi:hypothetical protein
MLVYSSLALNMFSGMCTATLGNSLGSENQGRHCEGSPPSLKTKESGQQSGIVPAHLLLPPGTAKHNFAPGSRLDTLVHGSSRPGFSPESEMAGAVDNVDVSAWAMDMKEKGIRRVVCLLKDKELKFYRRVFTQH